MPLPRITLDLAWLRKRDWWANVGVNDPEACWPWLQSVGSHGYGQTWDGTHVTLAHRVAWALHNDQQVPDGMTIDHRPECIRICCNPDHLRPLSNVENATDNGQGRKTHCPRGHPYSGDNVRYYTNPRTGTKDRRCLECQRMRNARRYDKPRKRGGQRRTRQWRRLPHDEYMVRFDHLRRIYHPAVAAIMAHEEPCGPNAVRERMKPND